MQFLQWMQPSKCKWIFNWLIPFRILTAGLPYHMSYDAAFNISNRTGGVAATQSIFLSLAVLQVPKQIPT